MDQAQRQIVREEFDLFCRIGLSETMRASVMAIPVEEFGVVDDGTGRCPSDRKHLTVSVEIEVRGKDGVLEEISSMEMSMDQLLRVRLFLRRFDCEAVRQFSDGMTTR